MDKNHISPNNIIIPPHLNAEVYRNDTTGTATLSYLDFIRFHSDGSILVGCSELTGRYWNGGAIIGKNVQAAQTEIKRSLFLNSGTADGCFINSNKVLLCEDGGTVSIWSCNTDGAWKQWNEELAASEHDDAAMAVDCLGPEKEYVTVGADGNIKVWDINDMICVRNYSAAHSMIINAVSVRPNTTSSFASGSLDQYITLWDDNIDKPVLDVIKNDCGIRCLQWIDENQLVFGDEAGVLRLVDVRNTESVRKLADFPSAVHRVAVHPESNKNLAICCDNRIVSVCEISDDEAKMVYHDRHMHTNYVRGLAWDVKDKNILHSSGWDGEIKTHKIVWS